MIRGSGGGGKGGGGGRAAREAADTLRSKQYARVVDVVSEGEIAGLVNGFKSVYLDDVPVQNADGSFNFQDVILIDRVGTQDQPYVAGFDSIEAESVVNTEVVAGTPVVRTITNSNANAARITVSVPALYSQDTTNGDINGTSVQIAIDVQNNGGGYVPVNLSTRGESLNWNGNVATSGSNILINSSIFVKWVGVTTTLALQTVSWRLEYRVVGDLSWTTLTSGSFRGTRSSQPVFGEYTHVAPSSETNVSFTASSTDAYEFRVVRVSGDGTLTLSGSYSTPTAYDTITGKTTSKYQRSYRIELPSPGPWDIRVRRLTADAESVALKNQTFWDSFTTLIDAKLYYPNTAYFACAIDAEQFDRIPTRGYEIRGLLIKVPTNYDPLTREYSGVWDGTFKVAWSDNPAWCYYDMITNPRYGLGAFISEDQVDKAELYKIAKYCDEFVDTGLGGKEPRFTCNLYLQTREDAYKVIQTMASIFRGMSYWAGGTIVPTQDSPKDPIALFTKANVIDGEFAYSGTSGKQRHTVALVAWNNPTERYRQAVEYVEDIEGIAKLGVIQTELVAVGCTSRGQAHRVGKWLLFTERMETETISFRTGLEGLGNIGLAPGSVIQTTDPVRAGSRVGGRIKSATTTEVVLDSEVTIDGVSTYTLWVMLPDGSVEERTVINSAETTDTLTVATAFSSTPQDWAVWVLGASNLVPETWRVISISEVDGNIAEINAIEYRADKYDAVEQDLILEPLQTSSITLNPQKPVNVVASEELYLINPTLVGSKISLSWTGSSAFYEIRWKRDNENWSSAETTTVSYDISPTLPGQYEIRLNAKNNIGVRSEEVVIALTTYGLTAPPSDVANFNITALTDQAHLSWDASNDLDVIIGGYLRIRYSKDTVAPNWNSSVDVGPRVPGTSTNTTLPLMEGTYLAKWVDSTGNQSSGTAIISTNAASVINLNVVDTVTEDPSFTGYRPYVYNYLTPTLDIDLAGNQSISPVTGTATFTCTRAGNTATRVNEQGLIEVVAANTARFDYDPVTLECKGLLVEAARTNLALYSEQADTWWFIQWGSVNANATIGPRGLLTGAALITDNVTGQACQHVDSDKGILVTNVTYTVSRYMKAGTKSKAQMATACWTAAWSSTFIASINIDLAAGVVYGNSNAISPFCEPAGNGWYRVGYTFLIPAGTDMTHHRSFNIRPLNDSWGTNYLGDGVSEEIYIDCAQHEAAATPSSYIPTTSAPVTRNADNIQCLDISSFHNASECTVFVEYEKSYFGGVAEYPRPFTFSDGTENEVLAAFVVEPSAITYGYVRDGGVTQANINAGTMLAGETTNLVMRYKANDFAVSLNGAPSVVYASGTMPTVDRLHLGRYSGNGNYLNGHIKRLVYFDAALTNAQLETLSGSGMNESQPVVISELTGSTVLTLDSALLGDGYTSGEYYFTNNLDLGEVYVSRLSADVVSTGYDPFDLISLRGLVSTWPSITGGVNDQSNVVIYVRTTNDDPAGTPTWSSWTPFSIGDYSARAFEFKLQLETYNPAQNIAISGLSVTVDMPDRIEAENDLVSGTSTYSVTYTKPFKTSPSVGISAQGLQTGDFYEITSKTASGFDIIFKNSAGTGVSRTFDYIAKGY